jgi:hypothetical protein
VVGVTRKVCEIGLGQASVWNLDRSMATARPQYIAACVPVRFRIGEGLGIRVRS